MIPKETSKQIRYYIHSQQCLFQYPVQVLFCMFLLILPIILFLTHLHIQCSILAIPHIMVFLALFPSPPHLLIQHPSSPRSGLPISIPRHQKSTYTTPLRHSFTRRLPTKSDQSPPPFQMNSALYDDFTQIHLTA
jgi:hypothetical protein